MAAHVDVAIVGAGIVGLATAGELLRLRPALSVAVLEREPDVGRHQTSHNSGVVHAGVSYAPGSLKARLCVEGARRMRAYCEARALPYERTGKLIVACDARELGRLDELERRARANGVDVCRVDRRGLLEVEPSSGGIAGLHVRETAIADFGAVARAIADDVRAAGGRVELGGEVLRVERRGAAVVVGHARGELTARAVVCCAGAQSDRLAVAGGAGAAPRIVPFRGGYMRLTGELAARVRTPIYPLPDPALPFLGVHVTPTIGGEVLLGPTSLLWHAREARPRWRDVRDTVTWPGTWRVVARHRRAALAEVRTFLSREAFVRACARLLPELTRRDVTPGPTGIRAQAVARDGRLVDDFAFDDLAGVTYVRNAPSPAATAAFAIGERLATRTLDRLAA